MSKPTCADIGGERLGDKLCYMPEGHPAEFRITYSTGITASIVKSDEKKGTLTVKDPLGTRDIPLENVDPRSIKATKEAQGAKLGECGAQFGSVSFEILPVTTGEGKPISWSVNDQIVLNRVFGDRPGRAFQCSDWDKAGAIAINTSKGLNVSLKQGFETIQRKCSDLLGEGSEAKCKVLKDTADLYTPKASDHDSGLWKIGVVFTLVHFAGALGSWLATKLWNHFGGGPPKGGGDPPGGVSPSKTPSAMKGVSSGASAVPASDSSSDRKAFWGGLAATCFVVTAILIADDATGIGVVDDPIAVGTGAAGLLFLGISTLTGEKAGDSGA